MNECVATDDDARWGGAEVERGKERRACRVVRGVSCVASEERRTNERTTGFSSFLFFSSFSSFIHPEGSTRDGRRDVDGAVAGCGASASEAVGGESRGVGGVEEAEEGIGTGDAGAGGAVGGADGGVGERKRGAEERAVGADVRRADGRWGDDDGEGAVAEVGRWGGDGGGDAERRRRGSREARRREDDFDGVAVVERGRVRGQLYRMCASD